jgi:hypothetical protein
VGSFDGGGSFHEGISLWWWSTWNRGAEDCNVLPNMIRSCTSTYNISLGASVALYCVGDMMEYKGRRMRVELST